MMQVKIVCYKCYWEIGGYFLVAYFLASDAIYGLLHLP